MWIINFVYVFAINWLMLFSLDFLWLSEDILISCGKDSKLVIQNTSDASHITDRAVSHNYCV